jgi:DNA-binding transcriptional MerR regulator
MIGTQLDLFGGLPKPPKKITIDEEPEPVAKVPETPLKELQPDKAEEAGETDPEVGQSAAVHVQMPSNPVYDAPGIIEVASDNRELPGLIADPLRVFDEEEGDVDEKFIPENPTPEEANELTGEDDEAISENFEDENPSTGADVKLSGEDTLVHSEIVVAENPSGEIEMEASFGGEDGFEKIAAAAPITEEIEAITEEISLPEAMDIGISSEIPDGVGTYDTTEIANEENGLNIPEDKVLFSRQYYTMRETSAMFQVNQSLLRFWENEFDILKPKKNRKGDRYFRPDDIKNLELIYHLLRVRKFTINGAKDYLKSRAKALDTFEMVQRLERLKSFLVELKTSL